MAHAGSPVTSRRARKSVRLGSVQGFKRSITAVPVAVSVCVSAAGCSRSGLESVSRWDEPLLRQPFAEVAAELEAMNEAFVGVAPNGHPETFRAILASTIDKDAYLCLPSPRDLFFGGGLDGRLLDSPDGERVIRGVMPHYGFFFGPMSYLVRRHSGKWEVAVRVAIEPPPPDATLELPDCELAGELGDLLTCEGTPYALSGTKDACPGSGSFRAKASPRAVRALLARWSREAEGFWNRDASALGLPVTYDFDFVLTDEAEAHGPRVDMVVPLSPTCGRTPYFSAMRAGWSLPILAHEVGHVMGLLDEYEMFSGIVGFYPKTPFVGAEVSRMGLSMREDSRVLPLHHYLILRRYLCPEPKTRDPYPRVL
jgi:hypothetical protein